jgi:hypothetical protein
MVFGEYVYLFNREKKILKKLHLRLATSGINSVIEDATGNLYAATGDHGIFRITYDPEKIVANPYKPEIVITDL